MSLSDLHITALRCEYLVDPLGIDEPSPRLSWQLASSARGVRQTAYRIQVASSAEQLAARAPDLWDSGRVESSATTHIAYAGVPLTSRQTCHWHVEVWPALTLQNREEWRASSADASRGANTPPRDGSQLSTLNPQLSPQSRWTMGLL